LTGELPDGKLQALMASCSCLCLPSVERTEAFGLVLLEAMRYGKAVIAADVPGSGIGWVVRHGRTGLLVRPGDAADLADAIRQFEQIPDMPDEMGRAAMARFQDEFHIDRVAGDIQQIYRSTLDTVDSRQEARG
jgi:rhamnosyl/mannosyltransferase